MKLNAEEIGKRIKEKQIENNYKQKEIIEKTGISKAAISNYIHGNRVPDTESALKLSKILNVSIEWILTGKSTYENITDEEREVILSYRKSDNETKTVIKRILEIPKNEEKSSSFKTG